MIAKIEITVQYGKEGRVSINRMNELEGAPMSKFAHSTQDAVMWVTENHQIDERGAIDLHDGRFLVETEWVEIDLNTARIFDPEHLKGVTHSRTSFLVLPVQTV